MTMQDDRTGETAVIFVSCRNGNDAADYAQAAAAMDARAAIQPGYRGVDAARDTGGVGITISYWCDDAAAIAWRDDPEHAAIRDRGRAVWYDSYSVSVARIARSYDWTRP